MSKSLNNIYIPAIGGIALVVGLAYGLSSRQHGNDTIQSLESRVKALSERIAEAEKRAVDSAEDVTKLTTELQAASLAAVNATGSSLSEHAPASSAKLSLGRSAHAEEIMAWDVDVLPDGRGLPEGRGDVFTGEEVFAENCASCHGDFAEGVDNWPVLAGGFDTLADKDPVKTVGSYWPYLSTVWDYVHRSMPFGAAQTMTDDEVYAIVAYILYSNDLVDEDFELSHKNFTDIQMHNTDGFVVDDRPLAEYAGWRAEPCMENCKEAVEITMRASALNVTPQDEPSQAETAAPATVKETPTPQEDVTVTSVASVTFDAELAAKGEKVFKKCKACHQIGENARNKSGPQLNGVLGRAMASADGFTYSKSLSAAGAEDRIWSIEELTGFLAKPKKYFPGTKMSFAGLRKAGDIDAVIEYLRSDEP